MTRVPRPVRPLAALALLALAACDGAAPEPASGGRAVYAALDAGRTAVALYTAVPGDPAPPDTLLTRSDLAAVGAALDGAFASVAWSPDGRSVAFGVVENEGGAVGVVSADGRVRALTEMASATSDPRWSPSGQTILVEKAGFLGAQVGTFAVAADGAGGAACVVCADRPLQLGRPALLAGRAAWGRTDDELAVAVADPADAAGSPGRYPTHVYLVDRQTLRPVRRLTAEPVEGAAFALAPGGGAAAFTRGRGAERVLYAVRPLGSEPVVVARGADVGPYGWGRDGRLWCVERGARGLAAFRVVAPGSGASVDLGQGAGEVYGADLAAR